MNLKCLMTEENETVHQIQTEMERLLRIVNESEEIIANKDNTIATLQMSFEANEKMNRFDNTKENQISKLNQKVCKLKEIIEIKDTEIENITNNLEAHTNFFNKTKIETNLTLEELKRNIDVKEGEIRKLIEDQSTSQECQEIFSRNEILQKEQLVLTVSLQQKDLDIKSLNNMVTQKEEKIVELHEQKESFVVDKNNILKEREEIISNLQNRIMREQENHKETEDELIKLRLELESFKQEKLNYSSKSTTGEESLNSSLKEKNEEIERLKNVILQEQQIVSHIQFTQEKEIISKEKEIFLLNHNVSDLKQNLAEKDIELESLRNRNKTRKISGKVCLQQVDIKCY